MDKPKALRTKRVELMLTDEEFSAFEKLAEEAGLKVGQVIRMKLKGTEITPKAA